MCTFCVCGLVKGVLWKGKTSACVCEGQSCRRGNDLCMLCVGRRTGVCRHGIFPPIGGFPPIERSHRSFLRSVQIR